MLAALRQAAGEQATIVVPTGTAGNSTTSSAFHRATAGMSEIARIQYLAAMPGFDPRTSPSEGMGRLAEHIRTSPGASRSSHPQTSFAALGPRAAACTAKHRLDCHLGEDSPLGWLYHSAATVLLLGVGYTVCTAFHLAEYWLDKPRRRCYQCFVSSGGRRQKREFEAVDCMDHDFGELGRDMDSQWFVRRGRVGAADCRLFPLRAAVEFAVSSPSFLQHRTGS